MERTSIRLAPEVAKKLHDEARKLSEATGETVTVSDLIRGCIGEKFPQICAKLRSERAAFTALQEEVVALGKRAESLEQDVDGLVKTLSEIFPLLSTRAQVDALTDAIAAVLAANRSKGL